MGLAAGLVAMFFYQLGVRVEYGQERAAGELDYYLWRQALDSYQTESRPVAIYVLKEYLDNAERLRGRSNSYIITTESRDGMMHMHAMLARLYADSGETNLSAEHLKTALEYAKGTGDHPAVTNQATLWDLIDHEYGKRGN